MVKDISDNLWTLMEIGGPVMIPIFLVSLWLWILIVLKVDWIWRSKRSAITLAEALRCLESGLICPMSSSPRVSALNFFMGDGKHGRNCEPSSGQLFLEVAVRRQRQMIYRFIPTIIILAAAAPLLGLFGTVSGMVETFRVIGMYGMGNAQAMASGIREAMITTQAGLLVAIPGIFIGQVLKKKANNIQRDLLVFQRGISQWIEKESGI